MLEKPKRPGLREWYIERLPLLTGISEDEAVRLVEQFGLDWEALLREAKEIVRSR